MADPRTEPCSVCGREPDECICMSSPDFLDDQPIRELDDPEYLDFGYYEEFNRALDEEKTNDTTK